MHLDMNQPETHITAADDSHKIVHEAIPPPASPKVVIPGPADHSTGVLPNGKPPATNRGRLYGMALAWRGVRLLGFALGVAAVWFVAAWLRHGRMPLTATASPMGGTLSPVLPPTWLLAILGLMVLISICMMFLGTQDAIPKMRAKKDG